MIKENSEFSEKGDVAVGCVVIMMCVVALLGKSYYCILSHIIAYYRILSHMLQSTEADYTSYLNYFTILYTQKCGPPKVTAYCYLAIVT